MPWPTYKVGRWIALAPLAALAVTVGVHLWRRDALLSIFAGTAVHVALASTVFAH